MAPPRASQPAKATAPEPSLPARVAAPRVGILPTAKAEWQKHRMAMSTPPGTATSTRRTPMVAGRKTRATAGRALQSQNRSLPTPAPVPAAGLRTARAWSQQRNRASGETRNLHAASRSGSRAARVKVGVAEREAVLAPEEAEAAGAADNCPPHTMKPREQ